MTALDKTHLFRHALSAEPERLHFAAHSHHLWPDASRAGHERAWLDAAERADEKWNVVFGEVYPRAQGHVARFLGVEDPSRVAFSANTHDLVVRLLSAHPRWRGDRPLRVLSTDAEFHSFTRQMRRLVEAGAVEWERVPAEPFAGLAERFGARAASGGWDVVFASHVLFSSGYVFDEVFEILAGLPDDTIAAVDGYHGFFALPTDFGPYADRLYYTSGGYKYAMSGEGVSFLVAPDGREPRPEITGWFAGFSGLGGPQDGPVAYDDGANRFLGATFEPTPLYRFNAVVDALEAEGVGVPELHAHAEALQARFLERVDAGRVGDLTLESLVPTRAELEGRRRGHFLTFARSDAQTLHEALLAARIVTDVRGDRLRVGFGLYQTLDQVDALAERWSSL